MSRNDLHAIDGGMLGYPLCQSTEGDTVLAELDVTCSDCLDILDELDEGDVRRSELLARGFICLPERTLSVPCVLRGDDQ